MKGAWHRLLTPLLLALLTLSCGGGSTGPDPGNQLPAYDEYFPLTVGSRWVYQSWSIDEDDSTRHTLNTTIRTLTRSLFHEGYLGVESIDTIAPGDENEGHRLTLRRNENGGHYCTTLFFEPVPNDEYGEWNLQYEFHPDSVGAVWMYRGGDDVEYYWSFRGTGRTVVTEQDTFRNCIENVWTANNPDTYVAIHHYFAPGIGEVLEERFNTENGSVVWHYRRELVEWSIAD